MVNEFCSSMVRNVIDMVQKYFFSVQILLYSSRNIFSTSCISYAWLAISHVPVVLNSLLIFMNRCQCACTFWNFYILFCVGMCGGNSGWSDMAWQMNLSYLTEGYSDMFIRWTLVLRCNMMPNWHFFEVFTHFCLFRVFYSDEHVPYDICRSVSQKCDICQLQSYDT